MVPISIVEYETDVLMLSVVVDDVVVEVADAPHPARTSALRHSATRFISLA